MSSTSFIDADATRALLDGEWSMIEGDAVSGPTLAVAFATASKRPWVHGLTLRGAEIDGAVRALATQLPFVDDAFGRVVLHHALERVDDAAGLLDECVRTLMPGGDLVLFGFHPLAPVFVARWCSDRRVRAEVAALPPFRLAEGLRALGLVDVRVIGVGRRSRAIPKAADFALRGGVGRPIYQISARKQVARAIMLPLKRDRARASAPALVPSVRTLEAA